MGLLGANGSLALAARVGAAVALVATALPACIESGCHIVAHCEGDDLHYCAMDYDTGSSELTTHCAANGRVCRKSGATVACVYADRPCVKDACDGDRVAGCTPLGLVGDYVDCPHEEPGRTCFESPSRPECGYPAIDCPASGGDELCGPDGVSVYSGCGAHAGHPLHREDCATSGDVCTTANGDVGCVDPALMACSRQTPFFCSADATHAYFCGTLGLVSISTDCAAEGKVCHGGECGLDVACDGARMNTWCSADRSMFFSCGTNGYANGTVACPAGKQCTEQTLAGRTAADCR